MLCEYVKGAEEENLSSPMFASSEIADIVLHHIGQKNYKSGGHVVVRRLGRSLSDGSPDPVIILGQDWFVLGGV